MNLLEIAPKAHAPIRLIELSVVCRGWTWRVVLSEADTQIFHFIWLSVVHIEQKRAAVPLRQTYITDKYELLLLIRNAWRQPWGNVNYTWVGSKDR